jgi:hypothetical protein
VPFQSAEAYRRFAESVKHDRRYIYDGEVTAFLDAVDETAVSRTKTIPHGIHLWRAQLGSTIRIQDEGEPEEMEVDVPFTDARMKPLPTMLVMVARIPVVSHTYISLTVQQRRGQNYGLGSVHHFQFLNSISIANSRLSTVHQTRNVGACVLMQR